MREPRERSSIYAKDEEENEDNYPPQEGDGHMMTWGEIESTPMRIAGPEFRIP